MKRILNLLILLYVSHVLISQQTPSQAEQPPQTQQQTATQMSANQGNERKLMFSPYESVNQDFSANTVSQMNAPQQVDNNPALGPFQNAPVPSFGMGGMMPSTLGLTNQPYNYMYGSAMMHPLNPMNQTGAMGATGAMNAMGANGGFGSLGDQSSVNQQGFASLQPQSGRSLQNNQGFASLQPQSGRSLQNNQGFASLQPQAGRSLQNNQDNFDLQDFNELDNDISFNSKFAAEVGLGSKFDTNRLGIFGNDDQDGLMPQCKNAQRQAIDISNAIMRRQNKAIYKELMNYLLKSKYLIAMTEIKLTRVLRKKIYALMNEYSSITEDNIEYMPIKRGYDLRPKVTSQGIQDSFNNIPETEIDVGEDYDRYAPGFEGMIGRK